MPDMSRREREALDRYLTTDPRDTGEDDCPVCYPLGCDDPDRHMGIPEEYKTPGCHWSGHRRTRLYVFRVRAKGKHRVTVSRTTYTPYREWPLRARMVERLYRLTHKGQIRTLVIRREWK